MTLRFLVMSGVVALPFVACGLESGGSQDVADAGPDVLADANGNDARIDADIPDLGTGETESGLPCTCVPPIPIGWTVTAYTAKMRPSCPTGYDAPQDLVENPTAAASTCSCSCSATPATMPTCSCGSPCTFNLHFGSSNACGGTTDTASAGKSCAGNNKTYNAPGNGLDWMSATPANAPTASGGSCAMPSKTETFPQVTSDMGRSCALATATGSCAMGACVADPGSSFAICIAKQGTDPCPPDFPVDHLAGSSIADTRSCGPDACACSLGGTTCGVPSLTFYDSNNCSGFLSTITADGTCQNVGWGNNQQTVSAKYATTASGSTCSGPGNFSPQGTLGVNNPVRICCR